MATSSSTVTVAVILVVAAIFMVWWLTPMPAAVAEPSPPGQYPLHERRWEWPGSTKKLAFYPSTASTGSNEITTSWYATEPPKVTCPTNQACRATLVQNHQHDSR
jgi:hypothetical protein